MLETEAKERQALNALTNRPQNSQKIDYLDTRDTGKSAEQAATIVGTNRQYVADVKRMATEAPEWVEKIRSGDATITEAKRAIKEDRREQRRQENAEKVAAAPDPLEVGARFATILIDPPLGLERRHGARNHHGVMSRS